MNMFNAKSLGLAIGTIKAIALFVIGILAATIGWWLDGVDIMGAFLIGYQATFIGSIIGAIWGFVCGFVGGYVIAWLYNKFNG